MLLLSKRHLGQPGWGMTDHHFWPRTQPCFGKTSPRDNAGGGGIAIYGPANIGMTPQDSFHSIN